MRRYEESCSIIRSIQHTVGRTRNRSCDCLLGLCPAANRAPNKCRKGRLGPENRDYTVVNRDDSDQSYLSLPLSLCLSLSLSVFVCLPLCISLSLSLRPLLDRILIEDTSIPIRSAVIV